MRQDPLNDCPVLDGHQQAQYDLWKLSKKRKALEKKVRNLAA